MDKRVKQLLRQIEKWDGWTVERRGSGWFAWPPDKSKKPVAIHGTPSDWRVWKNTIAELRRAGGKI